MQLFGVPNQNNLDIHGLKNLRRVYWNLPTPVLIEEAVSRKEGVISANGAFVALTGEHTGRSPNDKYVVQYHDESAQEIWWGKVNQPMSPENYERLYAKMLAYFQGRDVFVQDLSVGADPHYSIPIRIITEKAWHSLFSRNLFIRNDLERMNNQKPEFTVIQSEGIQADPATDGTRSSTFIVVNFNTKVILIGSSGYAGEIKKSIFTIMNYLMPHRDVLSMHCSANVGERGDVALFFGLSGTGKTTLSSDPFRQLIGDDEHGWSDTGVFNFEGGCYAKTIRLNRDFEPIIWEASQRFGAVLENVVIDENSREVDFDKDNYTENTRGAYPIDYVANHVIDGYAGHPENIFFLSADAFGVLPPIANLSIDQIPVFFLSGYTSKLAGTEKGLGAEPEATFSACFGAPFLPLHPITYANLLINKIKNHKVNVWLVNTGWTGGPYGVGSRFKLPYTRSIIHAALGNKLEETSYTVEPFFGLRIPDNCPGVPSQVLNPQKTWQDPEAYAVQAKKLKALFDVNYRNITSNLR